MSLRAQSLKDIFTFTRSTTATYFDINGVLTYAAVDEPRIDYDPATLACRGLLLEEQRTNLILSSATFITQDVTVTNVPHTLSFYGTGTITLSGASTAGPLVGVGLLTRVSVTFTPTAGTLTLTVSGDAIYAQLEAGMYATSWIAVGSEPVSRAADVCYATTLEPWFNEDEGTILVDFSIPWFTTADTTSRFLVYAVGDASNYHALYVNAGDIRAESNSTSLVFFKNFGSYSAGDQLKIAYAWGDGGYSAALTDETLVSGSGASPQGISSFYIGAPNQPGGYIRKVKFYPRRLSNAELAALVA